MIQVGWIDFSPSHRDKVGAALDLLRPEGMVDELGMGTLRDGMANQLFPGISTIQTRAKYFFIVPYILYELQQLIVQGQGKGKNPSKYLEQREYEIMWYLAEYYHYEDNHGVIGITKRKPQKIIRRPSAIYWNGINLYRFLENQGLSCEVFLKKANKGEYESLLSSLNQSDDPSDDADAEYENKFHLRVTPPKDWTNELTLDLLPSEAEFFYHTIISTTKGKLISQLLTNEALWNVYQSADSFMQFAKAAQALLPDTPLKKDLILAHDFSELMFGAHLTYNCLIQQAHFRNNTYERDWEAWLFNLKNNMISYQDFDLDKLLSYTTHPRKSTVDFVRSWWQLINSTPIELKRRNELVQEQEYNVKRNKARLRYKKFDEVKEEKWVGLGYFDYRFNNARTIIQDIKTGMPD
jgi:hypothetical protein